MEKLTHTALGKTDTYEVVESIPLGYMIWNIGKNAPEGYLPLCRPAVHQSHPEGRDIDPKSLKAIKVENTQDILAAASHGLNTLSKMEQYVKRYKNSKTESVQHYVNLCRKAIPAMRKIQGIEHLRDW